MENEKPDRPSQRNVVIRSREKDYDHPVAKDQKLFRFIQTHDETVSHEYMQLKRQLAEMFPHDRDVYRTVKGRFVEGVLSAYRLGEKTAAAKVVEGGGKEDKRVKYWIYQFEATEKAMADMEAYCQKNELTMDEFFQEAVRYWINLVENDPEGGRKAGRRRKGAGRYGWIRKQNGYGSRWHTCG